jgi:hypothetical protein
MRDNLKCTPFEDAVSIKKYIRELKITTSKSKAINSIGILFNKYLEAPQNTKEGIFDQYNTTNAFFPQIRLTKSDFGAGEAFSGIGLSAASTKAGSLDVTTLADGLARFLADRTKKELQVAFFQHFKKIIEDEKEKGASSPLAPVTKQPRSLPKTCFGGGTILGYITTPTHRSSSCCAPTAFRSTSRKHPFTNPLHCFTPQKPLFPGLPAPLPYCFTNQTKSCLFTSSVFCFFFHPCLLVRAAQKKYSPRQPASFFNLLRPPNSARKKPRHQQPTSFFNP